jgi:hypothetical protein
MDFFLTNDLTTQSASWNDLSASSNSIKFEALTKIETVFPGCFTPVNLIILSSTFSATSAASPRLSLVNWSMLAIGVHPMVFEMNST